MQCVMAFCTQNPATATDTGGTPAHLLCEPRVQAGLAGYNLGTCPVVPGVLTTLIGSRTGTAAACCGPQRLGGCRGLLPGWPGAGLPTAAAAGWRWPGGTRAFPAAAAAPAGGRRTRIRRRAGVWPGSSRAGPRPGSGQLQARARGRPALRDARGAGRARARAPLRGGRLAGAGARARLAHGSIPCRRARAWGRSAGRRGPGAIKGTEGAGSKRQPEGVQADPSPAAFVLVLARML